MTITQMEYIVAVNKYGSFITAADNCNVTQPTLSMQIQKLEDELGIKLFDRNHHPIASTEMGKTIIQQAENVLFEVNKVHELISNNSDKIKGTLSLGIIPSLAPYVLPPMLNGFMARFPEVELQIFEFTTEILVRKLKENKLDFGILSTPLHDKELKETPLFYEPYVSYLNDKSSLLAKKTIKPQDLNINELWTLNDEHCMHFQVINLCDVNNKNRNINAKQLQYQTGTVQSLVKMVENMGGCTIVPELSLADFYENQLEYVRYFSGPEPVREISLVTNKYFLKQKITNVFVAEMLQYIPAKMIAKNKKRRVLEIN